jgi:predicted transcriptional regulator
MGKFSRKSGDALTEDEIEFLRSDRTPQAIRQYASRQHESIGVRTSAYRKIAASARAEREALLEVAALGVVRVASEGGVNSQGRIEALEAERRQLEADLETTRRRLLAATAAPAMVVHSEGTGR